VRPGDGILDTSTVILASRLDDDADLPEHPSITAITLAELSVGPLVAADEHERAVRLGHLQAAEATFDAIPFDAEAARAYARVGANLRQRGRKVSARAFDALIASIAISRNLPIYTCNPDDFEGIEGLVVVAVPHPDRGA
jgi:predicted nucleic acid-binding protein